MPVVLTGWGKADRKLILEKNSGCCNIPFRRCSLGTLRERASKTRVGEGRRRKVHRETPTEARGLIEVSTFKGGERCPAPAATLFIYLRHIQLWPRDRKTDCTGRDQRCSGFATLFACKFFRDAIPHAEESAPWRIETVCEGEAHRDIRESRRFTSPHLRPSFLLSFPPRRSCPLSSATCHS